MQIHGHCDERFAPVRDAFIENFKEDLELGASACVTLEGQPVVDLWAGDANPQGHPWQEDTIVNVYSTTKTMAGLCVLMLADRGEVDFGAPVATYWPEFAQKGKENVLVSHVMGRRVRARSTEMLMRAPQRKRERVCEDVWEAPVSARPHGGRRP